MFESLNFWLNFFSLLLILVIRLELFEHTFIFFILILIRDQKKKVCKKCFLVINTFKKFNKVI